MTRVALVDLLFYTGTKGGMESYVRNVYARMPRAGDLEFVALGSEEFSSLDSSWFPGTVIDSGISGDRRISWALGELTAVQRVARRIGADVIHSPANIGPCWGPVPVVATVHDLLAFRHPEFVPGPYAGILRTLIRGTVRNAKHVVTISEQTKSDLVEILGVSSGDVSVIPLAGPSPRAKITAPRESDLLLSVGNRLPHKNFARLIEAVALIPAENRPRLVITGSHGDDPLSPVVERLGLGPWVRLEGWLSHEQIDNLFARATAVIVPTLFEGFGLPILEAMASGAPVLCSDLPVLREVAGDAAVFFNPENVQTIASAITAAFGDHALLNRLADAGLERSHLYSWERAGDATARALSDAAGATL